jgi:phosphate starvation-inducible PhoH-like protein
MMKVNHELNGSDIKQNNKVRHVVGTNKSKRKPKNPIKFGIQLNDEQKEAKSVILDNAITILTGKAGSGKTMLACQVALDQFFTKQIERIIIVRSTVSKEDIGYLPGDLYEKMEPWMAPIIGNMHLLSKKEKIDTMLRDGIISIVPIAFMRGRTFVDSCIIVDEAQNVTDEQLEMILSRLGKGSTMMLCGDEAQNDFKRKSDSGFNDLIDMVPRVDQLGLYQLKKNHRHGIVDNILDEYTRLRNEKETTKS